MRMAGAVSLGRMDTAKQNAADPIEQVHAYAAESRDIGLRIVLKGGFFEEVFLRSSSEKVVDVVKNKLATEFKQINEAMVKLQSTIEKIQSEQKIASVKNQELINELRKLRGEMEKSNNNSTTSNPKILTKLNDLEHESKLLQIRLYGVPERQDENMQVIVANLLQQKLDLKVHIKHCYRIGQKGKNTKNMPISGSSN
nr:unnamed protein product [Callosobruchus analis]